MRVIPAQAGIQLFYPQPQAVVVLLFLSRISQFMLTGYLDPGLRQDDAVGWRLG